MLYNGTFKRFEPQEEEEADEWFIEEEETQEGTETGVMQENDGIE